MKLNAEVFLKQLENNKLAAAYWFHGNEPLQLEECRDALLKRARQLEFDEHQRLDIANMDASLIHATLYAHSLFSSKRIIEIALNQGKLNEVLVTVLTKFCEKPNPNILLILRSPKLETGVTQNRAYKALETLGIIVQSWPVTAEQLPKWFAARLARYKLTTSSNGLRLLSDLTEGNLLYAAQSVDKLALLYPDIQQPLTSEQILEVVAPHNHFDSFQLNDAILLGEKMRALKICRNLQASGAEIILTWGALLKEIRLLLKLSNPTSKNFFDQCQQLGIWEKRRPLYKTALQHMKINTQLLESMEKIDRLIKNNQGGDPWLALERFILEVTPRS